MNASIPWMRSLVAVVVLASIPGGCAAFGECNDCGECGLYGGPDEGDFIGTEIGTDGAGAATVEVTPFLTGECGGDAGQAVWLRMKDGALTVSPRDERGRIEHGADQGQIVDGRETYDVPGAGEDGVFVTIGRGEAEIDVTFDDGTSTVAARCVIGDDDAMRCDSLAR